MDSESVFKIVQNNRISIYEDIYIIEVRKLYRRNCKELLIKGEKKIILAWLLGYYGIIGNEGAYQLTKRVTDDWWWQPDFRK